MTSGGVRRFLDTQHVSRPQTIVACRLNVCLMLRQSTDPGHNRIFEVTLLLGTISQWPLPHHLGLCRAYMVSSWHVYLCYAAPDRILLLHNGPHMLKAMQLTDLRGAGVEHGVQCARARVGQDAAQQLVPLVRHHGRRRHVGCWVAAECEETDAHLRAQRLHLSMDKPALRDQQRRTGRMATLRGVMGVCNLHLGVSSEPRSTLNRVLNERS